MSNFEITDIPRKERATGKWKAIAVALQANPGKAVFVPRNGNTTSQTAFTNNAYSSTRVHLPAGTTLRTKRTDTGVYLWLDSEVLP